MNKNIELVKHLYDAFSKKDIHTILGLLSEDVEWGEPENPFNPAGGTKRGHANATPVSWLDNIFCKSLNTYNFDLLCF